MATRVDDNTYVHAGLGEASLVTWSPVAGRDCLARYATIEDFRRGAGMETSGVALPRHAGQLFRSVELRNFEVVPPQGLREVPVDAAAAAVLGWEAGTALPGAYPRPAAKPRGD